MTVPVLLPGEMGAHLGFPAGDDRTTEADAYALAATGLIEGAGRVGPIVTRSVVEVVAATGDGTLVLPQAPVVAVASAEQDGVTMTSGFTVDPCGPVRVVGGFAPGLWRVTYTAGRWATAGGVPEDIRLAVMIVGKRLWETQRGNASRPGILAQEGEPTDTSWLVLPSRAVALIATYQQVPVA